MPDISLPTVGVTPGPDYASRVNAALLAVNAALDPAALASQIENPESPLNSAIVDIAVAALPQVPGIPRAYFVGADITAARPTWVGPVIWITSPGAGIPVNVLSGDIVIVSFENIVWSPLTQPGVQHWYDPRSITVANGATVTSWTDSTVNGRGLIPSTSQSVTGNSIFDTGTFGSGNPGVGFPYVGGIAAGMQNSPLIVEPQNNIVIGLNLTPVASGSAPRAIFTYGGTGNGQLAFKTTTSNTWSFNITTTGATITGGTVVPGVPVTAVIHLTNTRYRLYIDGNMVIDQAHSETVPATSSFRFGFVAGSSGGTASVIQPFVNGRIGDYMAAWTSVSPDIEAISNWFMARRGVIA